jgi:hypothetical protein
VPLPFSRTRQVALIIFHRELHQPSSVAPQGVKSTDQTFADGNEEIPDTETEAPVPFDS